MKTVAVAETEDRLTAILDQAQREPVVIRRRDQDLAVVLSVSEYEKLRTGNVQAFLDLRREIAVQAEKNGVTEERLVDLLSGDEA